MLTCDSTPVLNRAIAPGGRLAAMARAAAKRNITGNRPARGVAEGRTEVTLEDHRRRARLFDTLRGRGPPLSAGQRGVGQRVRASPGCEGWQTRLVHPPRQSGTSATEPQLSRRPIHTDGRGRVSLRARFGWRSGKPGDSHGQSALAKKSPRGLRWQARRVGLLGIAVA